VRKGKRNERTDGVGPLARSSILDFLVSPSATAAASASTFSWRPALPVALFAVDGAIG